MTEIRTGLMNVWLTEKQTAEYVQCSRSFLANQRLLSRRPNREDRPPSLYFAKDHGIPFVQLGRLVRYSRDDIDDWLRRTGRAGQASMGSQLDDGPVERNEG